ncbi:hypothetical protein GIB67_007514 [Kingdonia uniflora]|uniref:Uncharacterized protein n=1 Tax=Kingdonia uniflora TaxID=39325 RepID=A0A7J7LW95_9MAGN|nr:hypothetical protein GIB67_007514 [Kingdonia uniflora]
MFYKYISTSIHSYEFTFLQGNYKPFKLYLPNATESYEIYRLCSNICYKFILC